MVASPAVARSAIGQSGCRCSTSVSGPGQNAAASRCAMSASARPRRAAAADIRHMHDQRIEARPPLGLEDRRHRPRVGGIGAEAVDGLGRKRDEARRAAGAPRGWLRLLRCVAGRSLADRCRFRLLSTSGLPLPFEPAAFGLSCRKRQGRSPTEREGAMAYQAPVDDIMHALKTAAGLDEPDRAAACSRAWTRTPSAPSSRRPASSAPRCWSR